MLRTYYYDTNPLDTTGFSKNISGRLAAVKYPSQSGVQMNDMYSYVAAGTNGAGLPSAKRLQVNQTTTFNLDSTYTYNSEGKVTAMTYPSTGTSTTPVAGASYTYSYDSMYRLSGMKTSGGTTVVNNVSYNAANQLLTIDYPSGNETRTYNALNQLTNVAVGTTENLTYNYPSGANNGKLSSMYNAVSGETVTYTYDSLNRLLTANGSGWGEQYGFDGFGNLLSKTVTAGSGPSLSQSVNTANNQIVGQSYDANGNTTTLPTNGLTYNPVYDGENRETSIYFDGTTLSSYFYDAQNRRIWSWPGTLNGSYTSGYTVNAYSTSGQKLGAYSFVASAISCLP